MQLKHYFFLATILPLLFACKKPSTIVEQPVLIKSIQKQGESCVTFCTYDNQNRLLAASQCSTLESYQYFTDSIVYRRTISGGLDYQYTYFLASNGLATSYKRYDNTTTTTNFSYEYDANKFRTSWKDLSNNSNYKESIISNNNIVNETSASIIPSGNYTISSIFFKDEKNTLGTTYLGRLFLGSSSTNLKKAENWSTPDGDFSMQFSYNKDDKERVTKRVTRLNGKDTNEVRFYSYY